MISLLSSLFVRSKVGWIGIAILFVVAGIIFVVSRWRGAVRLASELRRRLQESEKREQQARESAVRVRRGATEADAVDERAKLGEQAIAERTKQELERVDRTFEEKRGKELSGQDLVDDLNRLRDERKGR